MMAAILCFAFQSCAFWKLENGVELLDQTVLLQGEVTSTSSMNKPLVVVLYELVAGTKRLVAYSIYHPEGRFTFVSTPGRYIIAAFEDVNEDLTYQLTEYAGYVENGSGITVLAGNDLLDLNVTLHPPDLMTLQETPNLSSPATAAELDLPNLQTGEVLGFEDARFSPDHGKRGLWEPIRFLRTVGGGVFFLEPYDEEKIPVLFVHGAGGNPREWGPLASQLDRRHFQP